MNIYTNKNPIEIQKTADIAPFVEPFFWVENANIEDTIVVDVKKHIIYYNEKLLNDYPISFQYFLATTIKYKCLGYDSVLLLDKSIYDYLIAGFPLNDFLKCCGFAYENQPNLLSEINAVAPRINFEINLKKKKA